MKSKFIVIPIVAVFFYALILLLSDLNKILSNLIQIQYEYLLLSFFLLFVSIVVTSWRYHLMLHKLNIPLKFKESFLIFTSGLSMLITPATSGSIIKSYILKKKINKSISSTIPIVIYEKWLELFSIVIVIGIFLFFTNYIESQIVFIIGAILIILSFIIFRSSIGLSFLNNLLSKTRFTKKFAINAEEFTHATKKLISTKAIIQFLSLTLLAKLIIIGGVFMGFNALGLDFDVFSSGQIYFTSILIGFLTLIPGGVVVTETGMLGLLLKNGVDFSVASLTVLIIRAITLWFPVLLGFIAFKIISGKNNLETS